MDCFRPLPAQMTPEMTISPDSSTTTEDAATAAGEGEEPLPAAAQPKDLAMANFHLALTPKAGTIRRRRTVHTEPREMHRIEIVRLLRGDEKDENGDGALHLRLQRRPLDHQDSSNSSSHSRTSLESFETALQSPPPAAQPSRNSSNNKRWLIPAEHPYKIAWDFLTVILSFCNAYATHVAIRDRQFKSSFIRFCEVWFVIDILLNFVTEHKCNGRVLTNVKAVWARYLTSWFVIDVLSLMPGEVLYIQPIIEQQNRRNFFTKSIFRTRAVVRVTRVLRGRHFKLFGQVASRTKRVGVGANRLLRMIIKYVPKYLLFLRNMKAVICMRALRQVHWLRKLWRYLRGKNKNDVEVNVVIGSAGTAAVVGQEEGSGVGVGTLERRGRSDAELFRIMDEENSILDDDDDDEDSMIYGSDDGGDNGWEYIVDNNNRRQDEDDFDDFDDDPANNLF